MRRKMAGLLIIGLCVLCWGCYEPIESSEAATAASDTSAPSATSGRSTMTGGGGGSALGGAMRSANSVVERAQQHSSDVANQAGEN